MSPILYFITLNLKKGGRGHLYLFTGRIYQSSCCGFKSTHNIENNLREKNKPEKNPLTLPLSCELFYTFSYIIRIFLRLWIYVYQICKSTHVCLGERS